MRDAAAAVERESDAVMVGASRCRCLSMAAAAAVVVVLLLVLRVILTHHTILSLCKFDNVDTPLPTYSVCVEGGCDNSWSLFCASQFVFLVPLYSYTRVYMYFALCWSLCGSQSIQMGRSCQHTHTSSKNRKSKKWSLCDVLKSPYRECSIRCTHTATQYEKAKSDNGRSPQVAKSLQLAARLSARARNFL
jgi:hypothetical protein